MSEFGPIDENKVASILSYRMKKYGPDSGELHRGAATTDFPILPVKLTLVSKNILVEFKKPESAKEEVPQ